ncbi:hypothetical protein ACQ4M3_20435 [Leptolyngbya sp. AN03gr2]|uniref:hypothetical protein n=1 Tax=unclassified Leptolyngbya TaxID=2650499 RepID=UPI003D311EF9
MTYKLMFQTEKAEFELNELELEYLEYLATKSLVSRNNMIRKLIINAKVPQTLGFYEWYANRQAKQETSLTEVPAKRVASLNRKLEINESPGPLVFPSFSQPLEDTSSHAPDLKTPQIPSSTVQQVSTTPTSKQQRDRSPSSKAQKDRTSKSTKTKSSPAAAEPEFDPKKMQGDYAGKLFQDATRDILDGDKERQWKVEEIISELYGNLDENQLKRAKISVGRNLKVGSNKKLWNQVRENPAIYQSTL